MTETKQGNHSIPEAYIGRSPIELARAGVMIPVEHAQSMWGIKATQLYAEWQRAAVRHESEYIRQNGGKDIGYHPLGFDAFMAQKRAQINAVINERAAQNPTTGIKAVRTNGEKGEGFWSRDSRNQRIQNHIDNWATNVAIAGQSMDPVTAEMTWQDARGEMDMEPVFSFPYRLSRIHKQSRNGQTHETVQPIVTEPVAAQTVFSMSTQSQPIGEA